MDWKIPVTIIILILIISLGLLPFVSPEFSDSLGGVLSPISNFFEKLFKGETQYEGNGIKMTLMTTDFSEIKVGTPTNINFALNGDFQLKVDNYELTVRNLLFLENFTGEINFDTFTISGRVARISSENFDFNGLFDIDSSSTNFKEISLEGIKISEIIVNQGTLIVESPQKLNMEIEDTLIIYGFNGKLNYGNSTANFDGTCAKIQTGAFTLGNSFQLGN